MTLKERLPLYADLGVFGCTIYTNPAPELLTEPGEDGPLTQALLAVDYAHALMPVPEDLSAQRLELRTGQQYFRETLLTRLERLGYRRDEDYVIRGDSISLDDTQLEFFGDQLEHILRGGESVSRLVWTAKHPVPDAPHVPLIKKLPGPVYLDFSNLAPTGLWDAIEGRSRIAFGRGGPELPVQPLNLHPLSPYRSRIMAFLEDLRGFLDEHYQVIFFYRHDKSRDYLITRLQSDVPWRISSRVVPFSGLLMVPARFEGGFVDAVEKRVFLTEDLLYGYSGATLLRARRVLEKSATDADSLVVGDYLIHPDHGIGQFLGTETREVLAVKRDYLVLRYAKDGRLYLPIEQLPLLKRHPGTTDDPPRLSSLGKPEWKRATDRAKKSAEELAARLIILYAKQESTPGVSMGALAEWDPLIENDFPYQLTVDQARALQDTFKDLDAPRPMDRLISGDVGFGKTEVALRAAHRVVGHSRQVGFLVPTTLLAEQHFHTFQHRFATLPVRVGMLSRFTSPAEERAILEGLREGTVDIVIGTHRLLSRDIAFKRLGLLIVDEEHRFGVVQKEQLREMRHSADVLSLSATPIPRTLYQSLVGLKDISSIQTPPPGRQPIRTVMASYDPALVREAIMYELERGGRTFYVHDRVASMNARLKFLQALVPEARIGVVHGQMNEDEAEEVMRLFEGGAFDVLLTTTIVESGLDIPEANTIVIERADQLGLASLYQLRGRVGRRDREAYAYLLHPPRLSETAERRLMAIGDLSDLGSGHSLAERDMEIRGVGNLLGPEQHGHIQAVSFEVYSELLAEAVAELKGEKAPPARHVTLDLAISARLSPEYIPSSEARSQLYGEFARVTSMPKLAKLERRVRENYGPPREEVKNFFALARLRLLAESKGVHSITENLTHIQLVLGSWPLDYDAAGIRTFPRPVEFTRYPPGCRLEKHGLTPGTYPEILSQLLYLLN